ncbi:hypothetical protein M514_13704 [Trichuris suis]|uniref:Uncharacterized protein n=1 Tax=Trichuris suis TaxID=68888 RepID=A0A085LKC3_9BILA|nr:hypothetical protein M513_13704 [Trichuris suis]KFD72851.1 hypothetical protein M514_13704 [Trichuris suis]
MQAMWQEDCTNFVLDQPSLTDLDKWLEEIVTIQNNTQANVRDAGEHKERKYKSKEPRYKGRGGKHTSKISEN